MSPRLSPLECRCTCRPTLSKTFCHWGKLWIFSVYHGPYCQWGQTDSMWDKLWMLGLFYQLLTFFCHKENPSEWCMIIYQILQTIVPINIFYWRGQKVHWSVHWEYKKKPMRAKIGNKEHWSMPTKTQPSIIVSIQHNPHKIPVHSLYIVSSKEKGLNNN